jgi:elongation factor G
MAFKDGVQKAKPVLMEPIMDLEVVTPEEYLGEVVGDINSRRGRIQKMDLRNNYRVIKATIPLANMFGYATDLRSITQGRSSFTMQFSYYQETPHGVAVEIIEKLRGKVLVGKGLN